MNNSINFDSLEWSTLGWEYSQPDASGCWRLTKRNDDDEEIVYYGQLDRGIPNGLGSLKVGNRYIHRGQWYDGECIEEYDAKEYDNEMNRIQNRK